MELRNLYPTQILTHTWENVSELNLSMKKQIIERMETDDGIQRSNLSNTWHSGYDMVDWLDGWKDVKSMLVKQTTSFATAFGAKKDTKLKISIAPWVMYTPPTGAYATYHTHPGCHFSSVYYVDAGKPSKKREHFKSGQIEFFDARNWGHNPPPKPMSFGHQACWQPEEGMMHMFRAEAPHMVHPYFGKGARICIAANITLHAPK